MFKLHFLLCSSLPLILSAPFQFPLRQPLHGTFEQQQLALQEQMFALQQFQALQALNAIPTVTALNNPPILLVYPNAENEVKVKTKIKEKRNPGYEDDDADSIIIDTDDDYDDDSSNHNNDISNPKDEKAVKAVILVPNARGIIGGIISGIPFFPIEVNVPDSIAWLYKWFSDLIAGWGNQQGETQMSMLKFLRKKPQRPIMMIPLNQPYL